MIMATGSGRARYGAATSMVLLLPLLLLLASLPRLTAAPPAPTAAPQPVGTASVSTAQQLMQALSDPSVRTILVMKPFAMPHGIKPVVVQRQLLVTSPIRAMIDWCDTQCRAGRMSKTPLIILGKGAMVTFNRLFFRNYIPHNSSALRGSALDFTDSPVPWISSRDGGQATYNLVVMHWTPPMFWVFNQTGSFWKEAAVDDIRSVGPSHMLQLDQPELYVVKSFNTDSGSTSVSDCYMPLDVDVCFMDQPLDIALIYCPYTFKDSLKNPWVDTVLVFHNIGLDRLVNSYRNPAVVDRAVTYVSCPNTRHLMDLDNITSSVLITAGGSLTLQNLIIQGSKSQNKGDWPSSIPLLLSTFRPMESGSVILRDSTVRVQQMDQLISALNQLPSGANSAVEIPDLQPTYFGGKPPKVGAESFTIKSWQLQRQRWLLTKAGGSTIMDKISNAPSWQFFNVLVESYEEPDCFAAAIVQGSMVPGRYVWVHTGSELLDQLANTSARYIGVANNLSLPPNLGMKRISVNRIVEIRSCTTGPAHVVDWANNHDSVVVTGNVIFEGNMLFKGIGWTPETVRDRESQVVDALHPAGTGIIEYEDLTLLAEMPASAWEPDGGKSSVSQLLGVRELDSQPLNMSLVAPNKLLMRGFYLNRSEASRGVNGLESFQDVMLCWSQGAPASGSGSSLSQGALLAAVIVPVIFVSALAGIALAIFFRRRSSRHADAAAGKDVGDPGKRGPPLLPTSLAWLGGKGGKGPDSDKPGGIGAPVLVAVKDGTASFAVSEGDAGPEGVDSATEPRRSLTSGSSLSRSRAQSGFSDDIAQACKTLAVKKSVGRDDELVLESVLGEGSYGKVYKATWRGTVVAVKIMVLPSRMTGKEKREKMAVMETAISSSLSHPNCVATYTYAVEPLRSNSSIKDHTEGDGAGAGGMSLHDSTQSWRGSGGDSMGLAGLAKRADGSFSSDAASFSWEVRLVQEWCDLGSLRSAFKQNRFKSASGAVQLVPLADTALDVARAMAHLHKHNIVHSDLKARNVLLRSDMHDPRGFTAKVADFGLSVQIDVNSTHVSNAFQGTMTHMAPETMVQGHISRASDVYGFGILMWELWTGEHAYKGIPRALLGHNITKQGMRPVFPDDTPFEWQFLACRCWESDPAIRPTFVQILEELKRIKARWAAARNSGEGSVANSSATPLSTCSSNSESMPQQQARGAGGQPAWLQQVGQLPCIQDTSDTLPSTDLLQQQKQPAQMEYLQQLYAAARPAQAAGAAAGVAGEPRAQQHAAVDGLHTLQQQQQQQDQRLHANSQQPLVPMCYKDQSRDVLLLLSDCDATNDSVRPL